MPRTRVILPYSQLQSVDRALASLELFSSTQPSIGLAAAAEALGTTKSTVHRVFTTLEARGYLRYDSRTREYHLGLATIRLGNVALASLDILSVARPHLHRLAEALGESLFLLITQGDHAVVLDHVASGHLRLSLSPGLPWPLHAGASNKALLAHLPPDQIAAYLTKPLISMTEETVIDPDQLRTDLAQIRSQGYAWSVGELTPDIGTYAVPIMDGPEMLGGLAVAGPSSRLQPKVHAVQLLKEAARQIALELGGRKSK